MSLIRVEGEIIYFNDFKIATIDKNAPFSQQEDFIRHIGGGRQDYRPYFFGKAKNRK